MKSSNLFVTLVVSLFATGTASTQTQPDRERSAEAVKQARRYFLQIRAGHFDLVPKVVTLTEAATAADPGNAAVLYALAFSYPLQGVAAMQPGGNPAVQARIAALDNGGVPPAAIAAMRGRFGDCVLCHGK